MEEQTEQSNDATGLSVPQQETTFEEEETSPPQGTSADPLTQIADALSKLLIARSPREIDVSPYDGTFEAHSFFDNFDAQADRAELTYTDRLRKLPCYLQARQTLIDLFPTTTEASFSRFLAIKLTPQMPLEDYYQNKTVMGMKLNLPADILIDSLTEGLPVADQRLIATVQPNTIKEWFDLVSRIRRTQCATSAVYQRQVDKAPHPTYHNPPPRHNNQRSSRVTVNNGSKGTEQAKSTAPDHAQPLYQNLVPGPRSNLGALFHKSKLQAETTLQAPRATQRADIIKQHQPTASPFNIDTNGLHTITRKGVIKIIIPETLQHTLMNKVHQEYNHPGISQMTRIITAQYYWKGISKSIEKFVKSCHTCQIIKRPKDTIAGFSKYGHSKTYLHVIVDHLTRYAWTFPSKSTSTLTYIQTLKTVLQQGSPKRLLSDRAPAFTSEKFRKFLITHDLRTHLNPYPEINIAREIANSRTQNKNKKDKETFDKQHRTPHFEVNDLVLVKNYRHPDTVIHQSISSEQKNQISLSKAREAVTLDMTDGISWLHVVQAMVIKVGSSRRLLLLQPSDIAVVCVDNGSLPDNDTVEYLPYQQRLETYLMPPVFALVFVVGVLGNGSLIYIFLRHRNMRSIPNIYIFSLAIGDFLVITGTVPFIGTIYVYESWPHGLAVCKISEFLRDVSQGVTVLTLTALSVDRYTAIVVPVRRHGRKVTIILAGAIWLISILLASPGAHFSYLLEYPLLDGKVIYVCYPYPDEMWPWYPRTMVMIKFLVLYAIPLALIGTFYVLMAVHLVASSRFTLADGGHNSALHRQLKSRIKIAKIVLAFVLLFFLCFFPTQIFMLWYYFSPTAEEDYGDFWHVFRLVGYVLVFANSCMNPVALYIVSGVFRNYFKRHLLCCCAPPPSSTQSSSGRTQVDSRLLTMKTLNSTVRNFSVDHNGTKL
ncbi:hypothetical protein LAZ67_17002339 [Cordylochernes scorpioides]|uniref:Uncharacterized protein n=1 Tax=Cordylochernes scorpioides TaxID=51811 RepID=A0ABY6LGR1_9ARAC|nr:hypothetical protein LAZ67_17002339 [Cordylochernes scorpioides]